MFQLLLGVLQITLKSLLKKHKVLIIITLEHKLSFGSFLLHSDYKFEIEITHMIWISKGYVFEKYIIKTRPMTVYNITLYME